MVLIILSKFKLGSEPYYLDNHYLNITYQTSIPIWSCLLKAFDPTSMLKLYLLVSVCFCIKTLGLEKEINKKKLK